MKQSKNYIGIGVTQNLSMRVSVGVLVRVLFFDPETGRQMLALERTATLLANKGQQRVVVKVKPFGGGVRLTDPLKLKDLIGDFHYDSERSYQEGDFRIQINPASWKIIKEICIEHFEKTGPGILDFNPEYELAEEFEDSLKIKLTPNQYNLNQRELIVEDLPVITENLHVQGSPTLRIYYIFDALIKHLEIIKMMLRSSRKYSDEDLRKMAIDDAVSGGKGRANAILNLDLEQVKNAYNSIPLERRNELVCIGEHQLEGNVSAILGEINYPGYQYYTY